ncbi:MAG: MMPL family transporter, partial [Leptospira sp.]|nr:MMPL family transporter [Leptospira sp.]
LPDTFPEVSKVRQVIEMIGGNGFFIICMKYNDEKGRDEHLKKAFAAKTKGDMDLYAKEMKLVDEIKSNNLSYYKEKEFLLKKNADILSDRLLKEKTVRYTSYRHDTTFLKERLPLFLHPDDMKETGKRVKRKINEEVERANPFYIKLSDEQYNPDFNDIINKYQRLAKRDIFDDYNISPEKGMLLLLVKPTGQFTDIEFIRTFEGTVNNVVKELGLKEKGLKIGYTGTYKLNLDDFDSLINALKPVSIASFLGITILLLIFFRNPIFIIVQLVSLVTGVILTFGTTYLVIGRLNTITSIMAAILMGLGIDYGIQFIYRFREEFTKSDDFLFSVKETIYHTGIASLSSALTTSSAFVILMFSQFRGFSEFGLIACYGIILIALSMYFVTALQISMILKLFPKTRKMFYLNEKEKTVSPIVKKIFSKPVLMLGISSAIILLVSFFATKVQFNYSGRDLLLEYQESLLLYDEIGDRFDISSDPQVIVVDTLEESEAVFDYFTPVPGGMVNSVDQVVSLWNFVPPLYQQIENRKLLDIIDKDVKRVKPAFLKPGQKKYLPIVKKYMDVKIFSYKDVPEYFYKQFTEVPTSKVKGFMLFIYPKIALWHGKDLLSFHALVGEFKYPKVSKRTLNTILYDASGNKFSGKFEPLKENFSKEEEATLLEALNTYSQEDMEDLQILPGTAKFIIEKRPFKTVEEVRSHKNTGYTAGSVILFARLAKIVQAEGYTTFIATILLVTVILVAFFRGIVPAILSLFPLLIGIIVMLGIMGFTGQKINFMNILVFPIVIGYGIQNGIYIFFRFQEEKNIATAMSIVGPAITASTLTTLVGWSVLLLAEHRGLHSLGVVASIGIGSSLIVAFTLLPSLLAIVYKKRHIEDVMGSDTHAEHTEFASDTSGSKISEVKSSPKKPAKKSGSAKKIPKTVKKKK